MARRRFISTSRPKARKPTSRSPARCSGATRWRTRLPAANRRESSMAKLKGLGRGLDALLSGSEEASAHDALRSLALDKIRSGRYQPRTRMDEASLDELAASIKSQGVMQPILVRPIDAGRFEIIAGERRWLAARRAGLDEIPALVRDVPDQATLALALIENIQREDLNPLEEAQGIKRLIDEFGLT